MCRCCCHTAVGCHRGRLPLVVSRHWSSWSVKVMVSGRRCQSAQSVVVVVMSRAKLVTAQTQTQPNPKPPSPQSPALKPTYSQALKAPTRPHDPGKPSCDPLPPSGPRDLARDQTPDLSRDASRVVSNTTRSQLHGFSIPFLEPHVLGNGTYREL